MFECIGIVAIMIAICVCISIFLLQKDIIGVTLIGVICLAASALIALIDISSAATDYEVYSGKIINVEHVEEWDEWIPPREETYTETDSKGNTVAKTRIIPGYWEHHYATNYITTSDDGTHNVNKTPDGRTLNDSFVNSTEELQQYFPIGSPTASVHTYENKVQASDSLYKNEEIDIEDYKNLPEYPSTVKADLSISRIVGDVPNKEEAVIRLNQLNTELNDTNNANNIENTKSYKQCNLIFVNLGDVPQDYGFALQNYWENGNKNDFIVTFGMKDGEVTWCYPISWTEVESLKTDVKHYMMNTGKIEDFVPITEDIAQMVERKFKRKEFADFDYIQVRVSLGAKIGIGLITLISCAVILFSTEVRG